MRFATLAACLLALPALAKCTFDSSAAITAHPLANEEVLEPSVLNEVDHALSLVPTNAVPPTAAAADFAKLYATNGLNATQRAIALVSSQKDGSWFWQGTNVTPVAVHLLRQAAGYPEPDCGKRTRD